MQGEQIMKQSKAYLQISNIQFQNSIEQLLKQHFNQKIDLFWEDSLAMIIVYDCDSFVYRLKQAVQMIINDYAMVVSCFIVPKFDTLFLKYLSFIHNQVFTAFEFLLRNLSNEHILKDMQQLLHSIKKEYLDTANVFINCNLNATEAAKELYLHSNSFQYRLNQFYYTSGMDIKDFDTAIFLKLLFSSYHL